jgi:hypothetical protein
MTKNSKKKRKSGREDGWLSIPTGVLESVDYKSQTYRIGLLAGQAVGMIMLLAGVVLSTLGISGNIEWVVEAAGVTSKLTNAGPGLVVAILGVVVLWRYKPHVSHETTFDRQSVAPSSLRISGRTSQVSSNSLRQTGPGVVRERVTYRGEQRGVGDAPDNRGMAGRIQHGEVRVRK